MPTNRAGLEAFRATFIEALVTEGKLELREDAL